MRAAVSGADGILRVPGPDLRDRRIGRRKID